MKQPKVYVKKYNKVFDVQEIHFDINVVCFDDGQPDFAQFEFEDVEFMENTGLKDKNGTNIYVGDIIEISEKYFEVSYNFFKGFVVKSKKCNDFGYIYLSLEINADSAYVIGNIYENKELLED